MSTQYRSHDQIRVETSSNVLDKIGTYQTLFQYLMEPYHQTCLTRCSHGQISVWERWTSKVWSELEGKVWSCKI